MRTNELARRRFELMAAEYLARMGERIRKRREELGLTQEAVARQMPGSITGARVSLWERGEHRPRDDSLEALARVLGVDVSYFMASEPVKNNGTPEPFGGSQLDRIEQKVDRALTLLEGGRGQAGLQEQLEAIWAALHPEHQQEPPQSAEGA